MTENKFYLDLIEEEMKIAVQSHHQIKMKFFKKLHDQVQKYGVEGGKMFLKMEDEKVRRAISTTGPNVGSYEALEGFSAARKILRKKQK